MKHLYKLFGNNSAAFIFFAGPETGTTSEEAEGARATSKDEDTGGKEKPEEKTEDTGAALGELRESVGEPDATPTATELGTQEIDGQDEADEGANMSVPPEEADEGANMSVPPEEADEGANVSVPPEEVDEGANVSVPPEEVDEGANVSVPPEEYDYITNPDQGEVSSEFPDDFYVLSDATEKVSTSGGEAEGTNSEAEGTQQRAAEKTRGLTKSDLDELRKKAREDNTDAKRQLAAIRADRIKRGLVGRKTSDVASVEPATREINVPLDPSGETWDTSKTEIAMDNPRLQKLGEELIAAYKSKNQKLASDIELQIDRLLSVNSNPNLKIGPDYDQWQKERLTSFKSGLVNNLPPEELRVVGEGIGEIAPEDLAERNSSFPVLARRKLNETESPSEGA